jgi:uncharacterized protein YjiS (DUF1127 family)
MLIALVEYISQKVRQQLRYNRTVSELSMLSDRDLQDLNINRCDIERIARDSVVFKVS